MIIFRTAEHLNIVQPLPVHWQRPSLALAPPISDDGRAGNFLFNLPHPPALLEYQKSIFLSFSWHSEISGPFLLRPAFSVSKLLPVSFFLKLKKKINIYYGRNKKRARSSPSVPGYRPATKLRTKYVDIFWRSLWLARNGIPCLIWFWRKTAFEFPLVLVSAYVVICFSRLLRSRTAVARRRQGRGRPSSLTCHSPFWFCFWFGYSYTAAAYAHAGLDFPSILRSFVMYTSMLISPRSNFRHVGRLLNSSPVSKYSSRSPFEPWCNLSVWRAQDLSSGLIKEKDKRTAMVPIVNIQMRSCYLLGRKPNNASCFVTFTHIYTYLFSSPIFCVDWLLAQLYTFPCRHIFVFPLFLFHWRGFFMAFVVIGRRPSRGRLRSPDHFRP